MNKNLMYAVLGILVLLGIWYFVFNKPTPSTTTPATTTTDQTASPSAAMADVTITLSEQNKSGEMGAATLAEVDGKVKVTLSVTGGAKDVAQPAHIHVGKCPDVGAVKYPLTSVVNGVSETTLDTTFAQLKSELPLGINVHKSADESQVYVSCGDVTF